MSDTAPRRLLCAKEVSALLGHPPTRRASDRYEVPHWFYRHRYALELLGFPKPVPGTGKRWDPVAVEHWLARFRVAPTLERRPLAVEPNPDWAATLDARAGALAEKLN